MIEPCRLGHPLPRADEAFTTFDKWRFWIFAERGHGAEWRTVFDLDVNRAEEAWAAIARAVLDAPVISIRDRGRHGVVCGVRVCATVNGRTAPLLTAWHYAHPAAAPRLVTAYPAP